MTTPQLTTARCIAHLARGERQTIVTYGTSLTEGGAWVGLLQAALARRFPALATVINSGAGGMWSNWGVEHLDERVIAHAPDAVIIEFAINDAFLEYATPVEQARANLQQMIARILQTNPACEIILQVMNPPTGVHLERRPNFAAYYAMYRETAAACGLTLIDYTPHWERLLRESPETYAQYVPDGIHPAPLGCERIIMPLLLAQLG